MNYPDVNGWKSISGTRFGRLFPDPADRLGRLGWRRFRRNQSLIEAKKANSDFCCEVCGFNFRETYGKIGDRYIVAHHIEPIGRRPTATKTTLNDLALVCDNCHAMLHTKDPPLTVAELRQRVGRRSRTR
ncbi:MAG: hypothetical protein CMJ59_02125 [Planctomycetaceae bacterium]|nr:hypothetical protein [Planctomycetaceae bacterium]